MIMLRAMSKVLPPPSRPNLAEPPKISNIDDDLHSHRTKWIWCDKSMSAIEDSISRWIHDNFDRVNM